MILFNYRIQRPHRRHRAFWCLVARCCGFECIDGSVGRSFGCRIWRRRGRGDNLYERLRLGGGKSIEFESRIKRTCARIQEERFARPTVDSTVDSYIPKLQYANEVVRWWR